MQTPYILPFENCDKAMLGRVGGKCASLGQMTGAGAPVPPGFAITTDAYKRMLAADGLAQRVDAALQAIQYGHVNQEETTSRMIRALIEAAPMPADVEADIRAAYAALCARLGSSAVPVAVRSSATAEDLPGASFAGQQDTFLWIIGPDAVVAHVRKCWSSLYTARAIVYRHDKGFANEQVHMAVAVQKMANARVAGVAMTLNPINGDRSKVVIDASWGLGESVVGGTVTPDNFHVDKVIHEITARHISPKTTELVPDFAAGCTVVRDVEPDRQTIACLTDAEIVAIAKTARQLEKQAGVPQDVEWALDADLPVGQDIVLLQSRPETVWSQRQAAESKSYSTGVLGVLGTLMTPLKVKKDD